LSQKTKILLFLFQANSCEEDFSKLMLKITYKLEVLCNTPPHFEEINIMVLGNLARFFFDFINLFKANF